MSVTILSKNICFLAQQFILHWLYCGAHSLSIAVGLFSFRSGINFIFMCSQTVIILWRKVQALNDATDVHVYPHKMFIFNVVIWFQQG